jgi:SAM-dependent methyltransferase
LWYFSVPDASATSRQQAAFEREHHNYTQHYFDSTSLEYRRQFILTPLCDGIYLNGRLCADLACSSGHNSLLLRELFPEARFEGFDISSIACSEYRQLVGAPAHQIDLTVPFDGGRRFDAAIAIGGIHHCASNLQATLANIAGLLKPGGLFLMMEPSASSPLDRLRRLWYRENSFYNADTECTLAHKELLEMTTDFEARKLFYFGGPAYYLILNSLVAGVPLGIKKTIAGPLFLLERKFNALPWRFLFPVFGAVWQKRNAS